jgi:hypothetical protein
MLFSFSILSLFNNLGKRSTFYLRYYTNKSRMKLALPSLFGLRPASKGANPRGILADLSSGYIVLRTARMLILLFPTLVDQCLEVFLFLRRQIFSA